MSPHTRYLDDDPRLWRFERTSGLPRNYFRCRRITPDVAVSIALALAGIALLVIPA